MRWLLLVVVAACGQPMPTSDAGPESFRVDFVYSAPASDGGCDVCRQTRTLDETALIEARGTYNSTLTGWNCRLEPDGFLHDAGAVVIDCSARCEQPPRTPDAGCGWDF